MHFRDVSETITKIRTDHLTRNASAARRPRYQANQTKQSQTVSHWKLKVRLIGQLRVDDLQIYMPDIYLYLYFLKKKALKFWTVPIGSPQKQ